MGTLSVAAIAVAAYLLGVLTPILLLGVLASREAKTDQR
jgi:cytochrome c biogenesis protein CcdA